jgi:methylthioribose-1-phosphate isomerase
MRVIAIKHIEWLGDCLKVLDQKALPNEVRWLYCKNVEDVFKVIKEMNIRGAPLIGIVAAFGVVLGLKGKDISSYEELYEIVKANTEYLASSRPTAVNLFWALERMKGVVEVNKGKEVKELICLLEEEAKVIWEEDLQLSEKMAEYGASLIKDGDRILTHCNAGALATGGYGTALGVFFKAKEKGLSFTVYVDETRPVLQGARLTCWELRQVGIDYRLICDNMAGFLMKRGKIDKVFVGADRIVRNGGFANKIGTYSIAQLAKIHGIPFYVVAPFSSFDLNLESEDQIPIEQRPSDEVLYINGVKIAPEGTEVENPAFDLIPPELVTAIITEKGIIYPPYEENIQRLVNEGREDSKLT